PLPRDGVLDAPSSARWFDGWRDDLAHALDRSPPRALGRAPAVVEPTVWLLLGGWRGDGLLGPNEVPGGGHGCRAAAAAPRAPPAPPHAGPLERGTTAASAN